LAQPKSNRKAFFLIFSDFFFQRQANAEQKGGGRGKGENRRQIDEYAGNLNATSASARVDRRGKRQRRARMDEAEGSMVRDKANKHH